jgi:hypothetical protein
LCIPWAAGESGRAAANLLGALFPDDHGVDVRAGDLFGRRFRGLNLYGRVPKSQIFPGMVDLALHKLRPAPVHAPPPPRFQARPPPQMTGQPPQQVRAVQQAPAIAVPRPSGTTFKRSSGEVGPSRLDRMYVQETWTTTRGSRSSTGRMSQATTWGCSPASIGDMPSDLFVRRRANRTEPVAGLKYITDMLVSDLARGGDAR